MGHEDEGRDAFAGEDYQAAYVLDLDEEAPGERPSKRRRVSKQTPAKSSKSSKPDTLFVPLLNGAETAECVRLRQRLFEESWASVDGHIQAILRDSNEATLDQVSAFVAAAEPECVDQIPSAFIITGPNIASQDLLFEQLSERLQRSFASRFVRLRSSEAVTLKAALKTTIREATAARDDDVQGGPDQDDSRRYLDYDLEALEAFVQPQECKHIFVALQDSEGFDSGLLSDLISLFHSWRRRIPFVLLFGIATSVELLEARLLKSACRLVRGAQFDCVQTATILEAVFKGAVAASDVSLRLGAPLLGSMLDRQHDQMAGIQAFVSSLKYAYMCHFYANPLSILVSPDASAGELVQPEHMEALRNLPSFRRHVEQAVELGSGESLAHAKSLMQDDNYLLAKVRERAQGRQRWIDKLLRSLLVLEAAGVHEGTAFSGAYVQAAAAGGEASEASETSGVADCVRRMGAGELSALLARAVALLKDGDAGLRLAPAAAEDDVGLRGALEAQLGELGDVRAAAETKGLSPLRSKYSGQSRVTRTTVIAQRVQLSRDSAALRDEDRRLTDIVDETARLLTDMAATARLGGAAVFSECWVYESRSPSRDVLVPRPRAVFERSLGRPHDYLGCACCAPGDASDAGDAGDDGIRATLPATAKLYRLYREAGSLINVTDLWAAFRALADDGDAGDERRTLVRFYRALAELRALGFVRASNKKADHVAKVRWL